jgi:hypothetical protein
MLGCEKLFLDPLGYGDCCAARLGALPKIHLQFQFMR